MIERAAPKERIISALASLFRACGRVLSQRSQRAPHGLTLAQQIAFSLEQADSAAGAIRLRAEHQTDEHRELATQEAAIGYSAGALFIEQRQALLAHINDPNPLQGTLPAWMFIYLACLPKDQALNVARASKAAKQSPFRVDSRNRPSAKRLQR